VVTQGPFESEAPAASPGPENDPGSPEESAERSTWEFEPGDEIARGRAVVQSLGGGKRFEVHLVWDERLFALAVAKVLRPDSVSETRALRELREEAEALDRLAHPVLVRGFDAVLDGRHPHVLIEHLEGPTLRRLIRRGGPLPAEQVLPLAAHVAAALQYMSNEAMVHLDVKPDNIVMGIPPRLIDLSIARPVERAASIRGPVGTDAYMPPEQCAPRQHPGLIGPASDVWGLGASLYHAIAGHVPFPRPRGARHSDDPLVRFPQLAEEPGPLPRGVPADLRDLILSALEKDPGGRPNAAELALALQPLVEALPRKLALARRGTRAR
jgi:serine/threonine protein kinase